jgi:hypothetical protein
MPRRHWLALPFIGIQWIHSCEGGNCVLEAGPGLRLGAIFGLRVGDYASLNGELVYDALNGPREASDGRVNNEPGDATVHYNHYQVALTPLCHVRLSSIAELLGGLKVGYFQFAESAFANYIPIRGPILGVNVGGFFPISNMVALGVLLTFDWEKELSIDQSPPKEKMISATIGALF